MPILDPKERPTTGASFLAVPLRAGKRVSGALLLTRKGDAFTARELRLLRIYLNQAAVAIENGRLTGRVAEPVLGHWRITEQRRWLAGFFAMREAEAVVVAADGPEPTRPGPAEILRASRPDDVLAGLAEGINGLAAPAGAGRQGLLAVARLDWEDPGPCLQLADFLLERGHPGAAWDFYSQALAVDRGTTIGAVERGAGRHAGHGCRVESDYRKLQARIAEVQPR